MGTEYVIVCLKCSYKFIKGKIIMDIIVLISDSIDTKRRIYIENDKCLYEKNIYRVCNTSDLFALDNAVKIKNTMGDTTVTAITLTDRDDDDTIKKSLLLGADKAIIGKIDSGIFYNPFEVGCILSSIIKYLNIKYDIIMSGSRSSDYNYGVVGSVIANILKLYMIDRVVSVDCFEKNVLNIHKKMEKGDRLLLNVNCPVVLGMEGNGIGIHASKYNNIIEGLSRTVDIYNTNASMGKEDSSDVLKYRDYTFRCYNPPKPRPKKIYVPEENISPRDRLKSMMSGGVKKKSGNIIEGDPGNISMEFVKYIKENKIGEIL